ncbi:hypothetical protein, partial [Oerskovia paurometabola]|uniref:hypothetical protein n=1 Tax=Oerskovia paurometabola TaxID=162170 RepID=UPI0038230D47
MAERTAWDTVFATPEGHTRVETSAVAVRTDVNGGWQDIDTSVVEDAERLGVAAPAVEMSFSDGSVGEPLARITRDGHELVFDAPFELTVPVVEGSQVTYPEVFEGVDLVMSVHEDGTGFSEVLRVASPQAAANPALASLSFPVQTTEGLSVVSDEGGFVAVDGAGQEIFTSPTPLMWDSSADEVTGRAGAPGVLAPLSPQSLRTGASSLGASLFSRSAAPAIEAGAGVEPESGVGSGDPVQAPREGDEIAAMPAHVSAEAVTITPDVEMIAAPETVWPIYIDPSVSGSRNEWTMIQSGWPTSTGGYMFNGDQGMGLCDPAATSACSRRNTQRLVWEFNGLGTVGSLVNAEVLSATFTVFGTHSWSCSPSGVQAFRVNEISSGTTWSNHIGTWGAYQSGLDVSHNASCGTQRWLEFNVTESAKVMADFNTGSVAIGLAAANEGSMAGWKRYRNDATYSVVYNRAPLVATNLRTSNPESSCVNGASRPHIRSTTPSLWATFSDPDGQNVAADFDLYRMDGVLVWNPPITASFASGLAYAIAVPAGILQDGQSYQWHANTVDANGWYGPATWCEFTIDTTPPPMPQVVVAAGGAAQYPENQISGGIGQEARFTFVPSGALDVVSYKYSFNTDSLNQTIGVGLGSQADIAFVPEAAGGVTLFVQAVDRAGNTSPVRQYFFRVGFPA